MRDRRLRAWVMAARPTTLPASIAPVLLGSAAAFGAGARRPAIAAAAVATAVLLQIGTNLVNDVADFAKGADGAGRIGPPRAVQSGLLTPRAVAIGAAVAFAGALAMGGVLVAARGPALLALGAAAVLAGIAYTAGPWPLAYHGLGDVAVFVFMGPVATGGAFYVAAGHVPARVLGAGAALGCLAAAILAINNLRDVAEDERAGKRTLAVRLGRPLARTYTAALILAAYGIAAALARSPLDAAPIATLPIGLMLVRRVVTRADGPGLNAALAGTARLLAAFALIWVPAWL